MEGADDNVVVDDNDEKHENGRDGENAETMIGDDDDNSATTTTPTANDVMVEFIALGVDALGAAASRTIVANSISFTSTRAYGGAAC